MKKLLVIVFVTTSAAISIGGGYTPKVYLEGSGVLKTLEDTQITEVEDIIQDTLVYEYVPLTDLITKKGPSKYTEQEVEAWLARDERLARLRWAFEKTDISMATLAAMQMLESGCGTSNLTRKTKNTGNIKCKCSWSKSLRHKHQKLADSGHPVCYGGYDKIEKDYDYYVAYDREWDGWVRKVEILNKYKVIQNSQDKLYGAYIWAEMLHKSPYATDKLYNEKLKTLIRTFDLTMLDSAYLRQQHITTQTGQMLLASMAPCIE